jgi:hypothetical protein
MEINFGVQSAYFLEDASEARCHAKLKAEIY